MERAEAVTVAMAVTVTDILWVEGDWIIGEESSAWWKERFAWVVAVALRLALGLPGL